MDFFQSEKDTSCNLYTDTASLRLDFRKHNQGTFPGLLSRGFVSRASYHFQSSFISVFPALWY